MFFSLDETGSKSCFLCFNRNVSYFAKDGLSVTEKRITEFLVKPRLNGVKATLPAPRQYCNCLISLNHRNMKWEEKDNFMVQWLSRQLTLSA